MKRGFISKGKFIKKTKVKAEFKIVSTTLTGVQLTEKIGIEPEKVIDKDDIMSSGKKRGFSAWRIGTEYEESIDINDQIYKLAPTVLKCQDKIVEITKNKEGNAEFCIVIEIENGYSPAIVLEKEIIELAYHLNAEIEVEIYCLS